MYLFPPTLTRALARRMPIALAIAALLATSCTAATESVLCVGEDGHVSIEPAVAGACADRAEDSGARTPVPALIRPSSVLGHCGPCEDLPVCLDDAGPLGVRATSLPHQRAMPDQPAITSPATERTAMAYAAAHARDTHRFPTALVTLRSVLLQR
jgi:hypothetical protein